MTTIWLLMVLAVSCDAGGACEARAEAAGVHPTEVACTTALAAHGPAPYRIGFCVELRSEAVGS